MNILLTAVGRRGYLIRYFKKELNGRGRLFAVNSEYTQALTLADEFAISPLSYSAEYIDFLIEFCLKNEIRAVIPLFDVDVAVLSSHKAEFEKQGITVITGDRNCTKICNDKWETACFLKRKGLFHPKTFLSLDDAKIALKNGEIVFPLIVKPRWGMGSIGIFTAETEEELSVFFKKTKRAVFNTYLKYESTQSEDSCVLIQEKIIGDEFGLDIINDLAGNYVFTSAKRKIAMRAGETDIAMSVKNSLLETVGRTLSQSFRHPANLDVDCFICGEKVYVLEMNCRFGGQYPFSYLAGVNLVRQILLWLEGAATDSALFCLQYGVISSKELLPTRCDFDTKEVSPREIKITTAQASVDELLCFFQSVDFDFTPALSKRVDLHMVSEKVHTLGFSIEARTTRGSIAGVICGYANNYQTKQAFITLLAVIKPHQGKGIAKKLLSQAIQYAHFSGMNTVQVQTETHNLPAIHLYEKNGFIEQKRANGKIIFEKKLA